MSTKEINVLDTNVNLDESSISATHTRTDIRVYAAGTEILLYRGSNKIILPGAAFTARCHFELPRTEVTPSYNTELQLENSVYETPSTPEKAYLFCVGTDGCGRENSQVREVNYSKWLPTTYMVPFRFPLLSEDISVAKKEKYHGRKVIGNRAAYYFKTFESAPTLIQRFEDGTSIDSAIYYSTKDSEVETFVELRLKVTEEECREFFAQTVGINEARINTIQICTAWKKVIDDKVYYQDIRPLTKYNMPNEQLIELSKGLDIVYQIYY